MGISKFFKTFGLVVLFIGLLLMFSGCDNLLGSNENGGGGSTVTNVVFQSVVQIGGTSDTTDSTGLTLTFDVDPSTLVASDITVTGATKGALTGSGTTRSLAISDITVGDGETVSVAVASPSGFTISGSPQTAVVYRYNAPVVFQSVVQIGGTSDTTDSTGLTLTFDVDPSTLVASDITVTGATKGALTGSGTTRSLAISDITVGDGETVSVAVASPSGFTISGSPQTAIVYVTPYTVTYQANDETAGAAPTDTTEYDSGDEVTVLDNTGGLVGTVIENDIKQRFIGWNTDSDATIAKYVAGDTFTITENTTLNAIYTTGDEVLRKVGPAGGWVFYDHGSTESWGRYLEAWNEDEAGDYQWKTSNTDTSGTSTEIGTGYKNTGYGWTGMTGAEHPAADVTRKTEHGGYKDWFLPSKDELNNMYVNLDDHDFGGFANALYWSSSESPSLNAWLQNFIDGCQDIGYKNNYLRVRAVRAF